MLCPECNHSLAPFTFKTDIQDVIVDYCGNCAGIWTDQGEVNFIKEKGLGPLIDQLPQDPAQVVVTDRLCPKDRSNLFLYQGESVPREIDVYRCPKCSGNFFPTSNLKRFKKAQEVKLSYFKVWNIPLHSIYSILLPVLVLMLLTGGLFATLLSVNQSKDVRTRADEIIGKPLAIRKSEGEVILSFTTKSPAVTKVKYWHREDTVTEIWVSATPQTTHTLVLRDLEPRKTYSYQIVLTEPQEVMSEVHSFSTRND